MSDRDLPSVAEVRAIGQPDSVLGRRSEEHWTGKLYMRRISPPITWLALRAGLSANAVTTMMIVVGIAGVLVASFGGVWTAVVSLALVQLYLLLDCVDGEVARNRGTSSARGVYLDRLGHYVVEGGLMVAIGVRAAGGEAAWVIVGMAAALGVLLEKVETDLVAASRLRSGLPPPPQGAESLSPSGLAVARSAARLLPIHMITHAAEASALIVAAAVAGSLLDSLSPLRWLAGAMLGVTSVVVLLHLAAIWSSGRLD